MGSNFGRMAGKISSAKKPTGSNLVVVLYPSPTPFFLTVVVIAGTTAVGKTDLSLELCRRLNGEVVSADSVQVTSSMLSVPIREVSSLSYPSTGISTHGHWVS